MTSPSSEPTANAPPIPAPQRTAYNWLWTLVARSRILASEKWTARCRCGRSHRRRMFPMRL